MAAKPKILIISNDSILLSFLPRKLQERGYRTALADDADETVKAALEQERPDFVIADVMMPDFGGIELSLRIRQWSPAPIMLLTAWGTCENMVRGLDLAAESYLTEPFSIEEVERRMEAALQRNAGASSVSYARSVSA